MVRLILVILLFICTNAAKEAYDNLDQLLDDPNIWQYIEKRVGQKENTEKDKNDDNLAEVPPFHSSNPRLQRPNSNDFKDGNPNRPSFYNKEQESQVSNEKKDPEPVKTTPQSFAKTISDSSGNECSFRQNSSTIIRSQRSLANGAAFLKSAFHMSSDECATKCCYTQNCNLAVYEEKDEHSCYLFDCGSPSRCEFAMHGHYTVLSFHETSGRTGIQQQHHESELENLGKTPVPVKPTTTTAPVKDTVPLYGDCDIDWGQTCADRNAECRDEQCKCKEGYHAIYAYCRKVCKSDEFQCKNKGQDDTVPDCIDKEHRCDGVPQCADGSDEEECTTETKDKDSDMRRPDKPANSHTQDNTPAPQSVVIPQEVNQGETNKDQLKDQSQEQEAKEPIEEAKSEESKEPDSGNQESKEEEKQEIKSTTVQPTTKVPKTTAKSLNLAGPDKVLIKSPTDSNQGPIVALALGLGICLMLLIFVGCRLRTVKRRIRRGKSLHSNEADYLINGMYL